MAQIAKISWKSGVPVATDFDDPYFSMQDGLAETEHVFLSGNNLPKRFCDGFHIAELGFGTGLNMLATCRAWDKAGCAGVLKYTSFEAYPMDVADIKQALDHWPELAGYAQKFLLSWGASTTHFKIGPVEIKVVLGPVTETLKEWEGIADAWYLDGFSPSKNPEMWSDPVMREVACHTRPNGTFATYTAAGHVRTSLKSAGFDVSKIAGFGKKRHMTIGHLNA